VSHFRQITGGADLQTAPSVMLVQAPIFHGHVFSLYIELGQARSIGDICQAIAGEHVSLTRLEESPSNVSAAGQQEILAWIRPDAQRETGFWIWAAADNLRLLALNAIDCAQQMTASRPRGALQ
jgi:aspartate-semialdehyde dehydrogenase